MHITAYTALVEPRLARMPVEESIESLYDHVDEFVVFDCSKYDYIDLSKYEKVKKHVRGMWNPFHNPFGSMFSRALELVDSDVALFLDIDEIFEFKRSSLRDIIKSYPLAEFCGVSFWLRNYCCSRYHVCDVSPPSKGAHVFRTEHNVAHGIPARFRSPPNTFRRGTVTPDSCDGVRVCNDSGREMPDWRVPENEVIVHHTSHLDPIAKFVRSFVQFNHTCCLDVPNFWSYDMRVTPEIVHKIYDLGVRDVQRGYLSLYAKTSPINYRSYKLLDAFIKRVGYEEVDPTQLKDYKRHSMTLRAVISRKWQGGGGYQKSYSTDMSSFKRLFYYLAHPIDIVKAFCSLWAAIIPYAFKMKIRLLLGVPTCEPFTRHLMSRMRRGKHWRNP